MNFLIQQKLLKKYFVANIRFFFNFRKFSCKKSGLSKEKFFYDFKP